MRNVMFMTVIRSARELHPLQFRTVGRINRTNSIFIRVIMSRDRRNSA